MRFRREFALGEVPEPIEIILQLSLRIGAKKPRDGQRRRAAHRLQFQAHFHPGQPIAQCLEAHGAGVFQLRAVD